MSTNVRNLLEIFFSAFCSYTTLRTFLVEERSVIVCVVYSLQAILAKLRREKIVKVQDRGLSLRTAV